MGAIFSKLTNPSVVQPNGQTNFYSNPAQATQALAASSAATAQPNRSYVDGTINPDSFTQDEAGGPLSRVTSDNATAINTVNGPEAPQPKIITPTFAEANASKNPGSELSNKGKVLSLLLEAGLGAAAGAAASVPTNPHISPGLGPALEAGIQTPFVMKRQQNALTEEQLEQDKEKAQIAALPVAAQAELALKRAQTTWYNQRGEAVGEHNLKAGDTLVDRDGNVIRQGASPQDIAQQKQAGKNAGTAAAVQNAGGTPEQVLAALGVKPDKQNTSLVQLYLDKNNGDPGAAIRNMNADKVSFHAALPASRKAAAKPNTSTNSVTPGPQQPFSHVSSDGKWGWNGTAWVATGR